MSEHALGNGKACRACCCGARKCDEKEGCSGWIHTELADEIQMGDDDWGWFHDEACDVCDYRLTYEPKYPVIDFVEAIA